MVVYKSSIRYTSLTDARDIVEDEVRFTLEPKINTSFNNMASCEAS